MPMCFSGCSNNSCFEVLSDEFKWGKGNRNNPLEPWRSVAMEQGLEIEFGETIYIQAFDGKEIPSIDGIEGFTHDGCFRVDDVGDAIRFLHVDFFAGTKKAYEALDGIVPSGSEILINSKANGKCASLKR